MKHKTQIDLINELVNLCQIITTPENTASKYKSTGLKEFNISFVGDEAVAKYDDIVVKLLKSEKEIYETLSLKEYEKELKLLIRLLKKDSKTCDPTEYGDFIKKILSIKLETHEILYEFYGAKMQSNNLTFGDFTVYNIKKDFNQLLKKYPYLETSLVFFENMQSELLIGIKVNARDSSKALEIADTYSRIFENVFSYAVADLTHKRRIGILNFRPWTNFKKITCGTDSMSYKGENDIFLYINLDDAFFKDPKQGNDKIWALITKQNKNEIETRLLTAIEWIGKAAYDKDNSKAIVQFVFAIESMLQVNEKAFITPSIVSQLSDWLGFVISNEKENRKNIAKHFKYIYQKRSAIAHGGISSITFEDLHLAKQIAKHMAISFLVDPPFNTFSKMEQLSAHITDLKFN